MANRYNAKYIVVDTASTQLGGANPTGGVEGALQIKAIKWVNTQNSGKDIANNDDLTIKIPDTNGDKVIEARACVHETAASQDISNTVFYSVEFGSPWIVSGLYIADLDGGELQIFLD